jgi:hypothetical protein
MHGVRNLVLQGVTTPPCCSGIYRLCDISATTENEKRQHARTRVRFAGARQIGCDVAVTLEDSTRFVDSCVIHYKVA